MKKLSEMDDSEVETFVVSLAPCKGAPEMRMPAGEKSRSPAQRERLRAAGEHCISCSIRPACRELGRRTLETDGGAFVGGKIFAGHFFIPGSPNAINIMEGGEVKRAEALQPPQPVQHPPAQPGSA